MSWVIESYLLGAVHESAVERRVPQLAGHVGVRSFLEEELAHLKVLIHRGVVQRSVAVAVDILQVGLEDDEVQRPHLSPLVLASQLDDETAPRPSDLLFGEGIRDLLSLLADLGGALGTRVHAPFLAAGGELLALQGDICFIGSSMLR